VIVIIGIYPEKKGQPTLVDIKMENKHTQQLLWATTYIQGLFSSKRDVPSKGRAGKI
jgi:hypothetical protein